MGASRCRGGVPKLCARDAYQDYDHPEGRHLWRPGWCGRGMGNMVARFLLCGAVCSRGDRSDSNRSQCRRTSRPLGATTGIMDYRLAVGRNHRVGDHRDISYRLLLDPLGE